MPTLQAREHADIILTKSPLDYLDLVQQFGAAADRFKLLCLLVLFQLQLKPIGHSTHQEFGISAPMGRLIMQ